MCTAAYLNQGVTIAEPIDINDTPDVLNVADLSFDEILIIDQDRIVIVGR